MPVKPISPSEVIEKKPEIPDGVIEVFNDLIVKNFSNGKAVVPEKHLLSAIAIKMRVAKDRVAALGWLDVEEIFEDVGWQVQFTKDTSPLGANSEFTFTKKGS